MKTSKSLLFGILTVTMALATSLHAETLYGPGTIIIPTNQVIIINTVGSDTEFYFDGQYVNAGAGGFNPRLAIAGAHTLTITNGAGDPNVFLTFQRLKTTAIKTVVVSPGQATLITVPAKKTIQFYDTLGIGVASDVHFSVQPTNSASSYNVFLGSTPNTRPSFTGPATVTIVNQNPPDYPVIVSYYFVIKPKVATPVDLIY
jgi:hypothetical protein